MQRPLCVALLIAVATFAACERQVTTEPTPQQVPPELAKAIAASGREGLVAAGRVYYPESNTFGPFSVPSQAELQRYQRAMVLQPVSPLAEVSAEQQEFPNPLYIVQPGGEYRNGQWDNYYMLGASNRIRYLWSFVCVVGGTQTLLSRAFVDSIWNTPVLNTGGHQNAHPANKPVQQHARTRGLSAFDPAWPAYPSLFADTIYGNIASGDEWYNMRWTDSTAGSPCQGQGKTETRPVATGYGWWFMTPMTTRPTLIVLAPTSDHDNLGYVEPLVEALSYRLGELYATDTLPGTLTVTAATLRFGGLNDVSNNWSYRPDGHQFHRIGQDVDFRARTKALQDEIIRLSLLPGAKVARDSFAVCEAHPKRTPNHVHCQLRRYGARPEQ